MCDRVDEAPGPHGYISAHVTPRPDYQFFHNTSYLVQFHNAGARKDSVPGHSYFQKIEKFINEHYEEGENYREFLKFSCGVKVGQVCSFCCEWTGPPIGRCPKPFPDHACLPQYHYLPYQQTSNEGRDPDDWQPRVQLKKAHASGSVVLSDPESVARFGDKFIVKPKFVVDYLQHLEVIEFKKKKRLAERARESREAREKSYDDYHWATLCEDAAKLKKLRVPELNKYLQHHRLLKQHQKSSKSDKVKTIMGHFLQMNTLRTGQAEVRGSNESGQLDSSGESSEEEETDDDYKSDAPDSEDDSNDVVLAFIASDEEYVDERPATTRSGRAVTRRAEIDFSFF